MYSPDVGGDVTVIKNTIKLPVPFHFGGADYTLDPEEERVVPQEVALEMLKEHGDILEIVDEEVIGAVEEQVVKETTWLANFTGDPKAPEKVKVKRFDRQLKAYVDAEVINPLKEPRTVKRKQSPSEIFFIAEDGLPDSRMVGGGWTVVKPYERREFKTQLARWWLLREGNRHPIEKGLIRKCREPGEGFYPDKTWKLDDIILWLRLTDKERAMMLKTTAQLKEENEERDLANAIYHEHKEALKHVFFCHADAQLRLPTEKAFYDYKNSHTPQKVVERELPEELLSEPLPASPVKKKRGRPRKKKA